MDAECTGCGGRVMPYRQYVFHFSPTSVCATCGQTVRLRHFRRVLGGTLVAVVGYALLLVLTDSLVLMLAGSTLVLLGALLADFWTYRNLPWDPEADTPAPPPSP